MKVATLGPRGTFSQAVNGYHKEAEIIFKPTVWDVFEATAAGEGDFGIVPIENSIDGSVNDTLVALFHFDLNIKAEVAFSRRCHTIKKISNVVSDSIINVDVTRFIVLAKDDANERTGRDKTSLVVYPVANRPGILCEILEEFKFKNINLTKIASRLLGKLGDYIFYIDCEGHREDSVVAEALKKIEDKVAFMKILGSYPRMCN
ncbi:MAG: prephenate dehydratase domain-containing protein [bacterium]